MGKQLAVNVAAGGLKATGCCTPKEDKTPQKMSVPPRRVLPIIFIPGIMGSNLRMSAKRQEELKKSNNIAWRPDFKYESSGLLNASPRERQLQLDPSTTEVDEYDPPNSSTGDKKETPEDRNKIGTVSVTLNVGINTPLLTDDLKGSKNGKTKEEKARERGWGEIYCGSYQGILEKCEQHLNSPPTSDFWKKMFEVDPVRWGAHPEPALKRLSENDFKKAVEGCWFPVHAMGYNWLEANGDSALKLGNRIIKLIKKYREQKFQCEKVILITHSMGGLVARALIHPKLGKLSSEILGIVHGEMPAAGAPAAYKRIRSGTEESGSIIDFAPKILGNFGSDVTAVLGNAQGGLELLPSKAYGNGWLEIRQNGKLLRSLPENGDPYAEIYQIRDKWWRLLREEWLNPALQPGCGFDHTYILLEQAKEFHELINSSYHDLCYAHYGCDSGRPSWEKVIWNLDPKYKEKDWQGLHIFSDEKKGKFRLYKATSDFIDDEDSGIASMDGTNINIPPQYPSFGVELGASVGPGDQTVPARSSDQQLHSGKFSGLFRQVGYEHQNSYKDDAAIKSTLFSLVRIIEKMKWSNHA
ncbi:hypothetical protein HSX11_07290 [Oxalobacteraceae bacterium]|nr:hypothetical protein [Oxalobacteraceae bacterium]